MVLRKLFFLLFIVFLGSGSAVLGQNYFRVINGIPHLPQVNDLSSVPAEAGMLVYSTTDNVPMVHNGTGWVSFCNSSQMSSSSAVSFEVKGGIPFLPVFVSPPAGTVPAGSVFFSSTERRLMVNDGSSWNRVTHMDGTTPFSSSANFTTSSDLKISKLPVLDNDPAGSDLFAGALYISTRTKLIRFFNGQEWVDLRCSAEIETIDITAVTGSKAETGTRIVNEGGSPVTQYGICWGLYRDPDITKEHTDVQVPSGVSPGDYPATITGLLANTTYYVRAYAINGAGIIYGENEEIKTGNAEPPKVETLCTFSNITPVSAEGGGRVTDWGGAKVVERGVYFSKDPLYKDSPHTDPNAIRTNDGSGWGPFTSGLLNLQAGTRYYVEAYARNSFWGYGNVCLLETPDATAPLLSAPTLKLTNVTGNSIAGEVTIIHNGGAPILERGMCYRRSSEEPWTYVNFSTAGHTSELGTFSGTITGMQPGVLYYVRSFARNRVDYAYSAESSVIPSSLPIVNTVEAFNYDASTLRNGYLGDIHGTTATVSGQIISSGGTSLLNYGIIYSQDAAFDPRDPSAAKESRTGGNTGIFNIGIAGLQPNTTYYAVAFAENGEGVTYSTRVVNFTTPGLPRVQTYELTDPGTTVNSTTIVTGGRVTSDQRMPVISKGICWVQGDDQIPDLSNGHVSGSGSSAFTSTIGGLMGSTVYTVRAYASNHVGTDYGQPVIITTPVAIPPDVKTLGVIYGGGGTAIGRGRISSNGGAAMEQRGICWNTTGSPTLDDSYTSAGNAVGDFTADITALIPDQLYYVRAYAKNAAGPVVYGDPVTFRAYTFPTVLTVKADALSGSSAKVEGSIISDGGNDISNSGICYAIGKTPTIDDPHTQDGPGTGNFIHTLEGLMGNTTYTVRAYATNAAGTVYANDPVEVSFTTLAPVLPTLTTEPVTRRTGTTADCGGSITDHGGSPILETGIVWSDKRNFNPATESLGSTSLNRGSPVTTFTHQANGLQPGTTYYVKAYARNGVGVAYATNEETFSTWNVATVHTESIVENSVTSTSAKILASITHNGGTVVTRNGICWSSTNNMPTLDDQVSRHPGSGTGTITPEMHDLMGNTTYYVRAYAINSAGPAYADEVLTVLTRQAVPPSIQVNGVRVTSSSGAAISATITSNGGGHISTRGIVWSTSLLPDPSVILNERTAQTGYDIGNFEHVASGLVPGQKYYVWGYASSAETGPAYSAPIDFTMPQKPEVATLSPVTGNTYAFLEGTVISDGGADISETGFAWSKDPITEINDLPPANIITLGPSKDFSTTLTGLSPDTEYYVVAFARSIAGRGEGQPLSFPTQMASAPFVVTTDALNISGTMATIGGNIQDNGGRDITDRGVVFSTFDGFIPDDLPLANRISVTGQPDGGVFSTSITGLTRGQRYYYRAYASNGEIRYGEQKWFETADVPTVNTLADISPDPRATVIRGGEIVKNGNLEVKKYGLVWSLAADPTIALLSKTQNSGNIQGSFQDLPANLDPVTTYHVRAYAINDEGPGYGQDVTFVTPAALARVQTTDVKIISPSTARAGGAIVNTGGVPITDRGVVYSTKRDFKPDVDAHEKVPEFPLGAGSNFTVNLAGLEEGVTYYVRAYVHSIEAGTAYGTLVRFSTSVMSPVVHTLEVADIKGTTTRSGGQIESDGGSPILRSGLVWMKSSRADLDSESPNINNYDGLTADGIKEIASYNSIMSQLEPNTSYRVRAYAENWVGVAYGLPVDFTTAARPTLTATTILEAKAASATVSGAITDDGRLPITARGFKWSIYDDPQKASDFTADKSSDKAEPFSALITTGLVPDTHYYVWAYATNEVGTTFASPADLNTLKILAPSIVTENWDENTVTGNSAQVSARIIDDGGATVTAKGFCWSTNPDPVATLTTHIEMGSGNTPFSTTITGLLPKTKYYVRAYAKNDKVAEIGYSSPAIEFITGALPPAVGLVSFSDINMHGAKATAVVHSDGGEPITVRGFVWSTSASLPGAVDATNSVTITDTNEPFAELLDQLEAGVDYYVWAFAENALNLRGYSTSGTLLRRPVPATVITVKPATSVTATSAKLGGNVTNTGGSSITERGVYWSTANPPELDDDHKVRFNTTSTTTGSYTIDVTGLAKGTDYWYQAYAFSSGADPAYGLVEKFTTPGDPVVTTKVPVFDAATFSATTGGLVTGTGNSTLTEWGIYWGTDQDNLVTSGTKLKLTSGSFADYVLKMTPLNAGGTYYVVAYATSQAGLTGFGTVEELVVPAGAPVLSKAVLAELLATSARISAEVLSDGGKPIVKRGFVWTSQSTDPTLESKEGEVFEEIATLEQFQLEIGPLVEGRVYRVRAYAVNGEGKIGYGEVESFVKCPASITRFHYAGYNGAPTSKTITYKVLSTKFAGNAACWLGQNLGAEEQATAYNDSRPATDGWYWQFNQTQGYLTAGGSRLPNTLWNTNINENVDWNESNDPCRLLLGTGWQIPTMTDWTNARTSAGSSWNLKTAYASLKLHGAGYLSGGNLSGLGAGQYYSRSTSSLKGRFLSLTTSAYSETTTDKVNALSLRCVKTGDLDPLPTVSKVQINSTSEAGATLSAAVTSEGASAVTARGFVWNTTGGDPKVDFVTEVPAGAGLGEFSNTLAGLHNNLVYYIWAYAVSTEGTKVFGEPETFRPCPPTITRFHVAGSNGAPVDKSVTYNVISSSASGEAKCWITQDLGAADNTDRGWFWQFDRMRGYQWTGSRTPATTWDKAAYTENADWKTLNDPCRLLIGEGWRVPSKDEWISVISNGRWIALPDASSSKFKLQGSGELYHNDGWLKADGLARYWSSSSGGDNLGYFAEFSKTAYAVRATGVYKPYGFAVRCLMDEVVIGAPTVGGLSVTSTSGTSFSASATVASDGGAGVSDRGFVYNVTGTAPERGDNVSVFVSANQSSGTGNFDAVIGGLSEYSTYFVWAYASNTEGTGLSLREIICTPVTVVHQKDHNGAPESKTISYKTVSLREGSGEAKCWLAQNLGASEQADRLTNASEQAAGWFWQFNRKQGYKVTSGNVSPSWPGNSYDPGSWQPVNDPCRLQLGGGWRLPTSSEWGEVKNLYSTQATVYSSPLNLHHARYITAGGTYGSVFVSAEGYYWSSDEVSTAPQSALSLVMGSANSIVGYNKADGFPVRCVKDSGQESIPSVSRVTIQAPTATSFTGAATVTLSGGSAITDRGIVYNTTGLPPGLGAGNTVIRPAVMNAVGEFSINIVGLDPGITYYVWAFAKNTNKPEVVYSERTVFPICPSEFMVQHKGGENGAPADKTIMYKAVSTTLSGSQACWITQNLGASQPADIANEDLTTSRGWFWRYTSTQGYSMDSGTREPLADWGTAIGNGLASEDPCKLLLGFGWRMPTRTEWTNADNTSGWGTVDQAHASVLKLHAPGFIGYDGVYTAKGKAGAFWISGGAYFRTGVVGEVATSVYSGVNANYGFSLRCMKPY